MTLDLAPLGLSFKVAAVATVLALFFGIGAALALHRWRGLRGRGLLEALFLLPLVLPPVVTGYVLLLLFGRHGPLGQLLGRWGVRLLFTPAAAVMASAVVAFPLMYQCAKVAFASVDVHLEEMARSLGAGSGRVLVSVTLPLAWHGLVAGAVLSYARALGEFGATIMVAGNVSGRTTTAAAAIYLAYFDGDTRSAGWYALILGVLNLLFVLSLNLWTGRKRASSHSS